MQSRSLVRSAAAARSAAIVVALAFAASGCASSGSSASPSAGASSAPTATPHQLTVFYEENCQVELLDSAGRRILIDVWNPAALSKPVAASDILLTTHEHSDHYVASFADSFPGKTLTAKAGELTVGDIKITSVDASHSDNNIDPAQPTNHIFSIDFNGFRIAHMGSTGQDQLTPAQLAAIGTPDIAFADVIDLNATGDLDPARPVKLIEQMKPALVIPTHTKLESVKLAGAKWQGMFSSKPSVTIAKDKLPKQTTLLFMGQLAPTYGAVLAYPESSW